MPRLILLLHVQTRHLMSDGYYVKLICECILGRYPFWPLCWTYRLYGHWS